MADDTNPDAQSHVETPEHAKPQAQNAKADAGAPADGAAQASGANADALAAALSERDEMKERLLRSLAEMENLRRRTEREVADARAYAVTSFARDILNSADNVRRAIESVTAEARSGAEGPFKALLEGIELTERELAKTLERHGVKAVEPHGQRFDPNRHQAMFEVPDTEVPNGTVVQVVQTGYVIGERVLRPALVGVSKGGPKAESKPADAA